MEQELKIFLFAASCCFIALQSFCYAGDSSQDNYNLMKSYMNLEANPCDDFFIYSCENWAKVDNQSRGHYSNPVEGLDYKWNKKRIDALEHGKAENDVFRKMNDYFRTCVDGGRYQFDKNGTRYFAALQEIDSSFGWMHNLYSTSFEWPDNTWNWADALGKLRQFGFNEFLIEQDFYRPEYKKFYVSIGMPSADFERNIRFDHWIDQWKQTPETEPYSPLLWKFSKDWKKYSESYSKDNDARLLSLKELKEQVPAIDFDTYFKAIFQESFTSETKIYVKHLNYFKNLDKLITETFRKILPRAMAITFENYMLESENVFQPQYWFCAKTLYTTVPFAGNYLVYKNYYFQEYEINKAPIQRIFNVLKETLLHALDARKETISEKFYEYFKEKATLMSLNVGNLPATLDEQFFLTYYKDWVVDTKSPEANQLNLLRFKYTKQNFLLQNPDLAVDYWLSDYFDASPTLSLKTNVLTVPFGYLVEPFFNSNYNDLFLFSTLGNSMMNEIMHGFAPKGLNYDAHGVETNLYDEYSKNENFKQRISCLEQLPPKYGIDDKYGNIYGFHYTYDAYFHQTGLKPQTYDNGLDEKKIFAIKYAQFYCNRISIHYLKLPKTNTYKILMQVLENAIDFETIFNCPTKKPKVCSLW